MLDYRILDYKYTISKDKDSYLDLLSHSYNVPEKINGSPLIVNKYYVARPDLISLAIYGTDEFADIICKINGISNPFELNEGDLIYIPDIDTILNCCQVADTKEDIVKTNDDISFTRNKTNYFQKKKDEKRSSNEQVEGDQIYVIDKSLGVILF